MEHFKWPWEQDDKDPGAASTVADDSREPASGAVQQEEQFRWPWEQKEEKSCGSGYPSAAATAAATADQSAQHRQEEFRWPWEERSGLRSKEGKPDDGGDKVEKQGEAFKWPWGSAEMKVPEPVADEPQQAPNRIISAPNADTDTDSDEDEGVSAPAPIKLLITSPDGQQREHTGDEEEVEEPEDDLPLRTLHRCMKRDVSNVDLMSLTDNQDFSAWLQRSDAVWAADIRDFPAGTPLLNDGVEHEEHRDLYDFLHAGYRCRLSRNAFLAWQGHVLLPENHPLYDVRLSAVHNFGLTVHGGITTVGQGIIGFDCHHGLTDIAPYEGYAANRMKELRKLVGKLADSCNPDEQKLPGASQGASSSGAPNDSSGCTPADLSRATLMPPQFLKQAVPWNTFGRSGKRSYKSYHFARQQLCNLAEQLARQWPSADGNPQDDALSHNTM